MEFGVNLHEKTKDFRDSVQATANSLGILEIFIEKDYWVTYVLKKLSDSDFKDDVVFKGGTSLAKAFNLIKRFSEDIDLALLKKRGLSGNAIRKKFRGIEKILMGSFEEIVHASSKHSKIRKTSYAYPKILRSYDNFKQTAARDSLILELNAYTNPIPNLKRPIETYIAKYLRGFDESLIFQYGLDSFEINVLNIDRTFVEKVLCLARISIGDDSYAELKNKDRHFYDIYMLLKTPEIQKFIKSSKFEDMLKDALKDDLSNREFERDWQVPFLKEAPLFHKIDNIFFNIKKACNDSLKTLVYGDESIPWDEMKASFVDLSKNIPPIKI